MNNDVFKHKQHVQYLGESGYTQTCILAVSAIINSGILPEKATIVTYICDRRSNILQEEHLIIFWNWLYIPIVVIPSGFASGYPGEGPRGFNLVTCMIKDKGIPVDEIHVDETVFKAIDKGKIIYTDNQIFKNIKARSEPYDWYHIPENYEEALERGQLWRHSYLQGYKSKDSISIAISNIDLFNSEVGRKLKLAENEIQKGIHTENWQNIGLLVRDAWIELSRSLCDKEKVDISNIEKDKVIDKLIKLRIDKYVLNLCKASFDLSLKVQHDRKIKKEIAIACFTSSVFSMQSILIKYLKHHEFK